MKRSKAELKSYGYLFVRALTQEVPPTCSASKHTVAVSPDLPVSSASLHESAILLTKRLHVPGKDQRFPVLAMARPLRNRFSYPFG